MMFSWLFMILAVIVYLACVGWSVYSQEKSMLRGEEFDSSFLCLGVVAPLLHVREFLSTNVEFLFIGIRMLVSQDFRNEVLEDELSEE